MPRSWGGWRPRTVGKELHEECGVFGIWSPEKGDLAHLTYCGLFALQHRGQESAGIALNDDGVFRTHRDAGLVSEVFSPGQLEALDMDIG